MINKIFQLLLMFFLATQVVVAQRSTKPPKYTPKKLVQNYLDTIRFKDDKPIKNGYIEGDITDYIIAETSYFDVSDDKSTAIKGGGKLVICFKGTMKKGEKDGIFKSYFIKDNISNDLILNMIQMFKKDKRHGEWRTYDLSGNLIRIQHFKNDSINGLDIEYWFNGKKSYERNFKNGKLHGKYTEYSSTEIPSKNVNYKNGELDGIGKQYYPNGAVMETQEFKNGKRDGSKKYYYENGQLWTELIVKDEKPWQIVSNFDDKGKQRDAGSLKNGKGTVIYYNENGTLREIINYQNGVEIK